MKKEIAMLWADELESGKHEQGHEYLMDRNGKKCCLGVLCQMAVEAHVIPQPREYESSHTAFGEHRDIHILPEEVRRWADMRSQSGRMEKVDEAGFKDSLIRKNDHGSTFPEIAAIIREHWEEL